MAAQWPLEATQAEVTAAIRAEMARHGIDQHQLAEALGTTQQSISRRLCGTTRLTVEEITIIADTIGCPASRLLTP
jgi:transcriptional regulator with XRE-family HTH domain